MKKLLAVLLTAFTLMFFTACDTGSDPIDETYAPAAPTALAVTAISDTEVTISWTDNSDNERGFAIERAVDDGEYAAVDQTGKSTFSEDLPDNTTYKYRVTAYNNFGNSIASNEAAAKRPVQAEEDIVKEDGATIAMGTVASVVIAPNGISGNGTIQAVEGVKEDSIPAEQELNLSVLSDIKIFSVVDFSNADLTLTANVGVTMNYDPAMITEYNSGLEAQFADLVTQGAYTQDQVDSYKLAAADLDIYYYNTHLGRWTKTRAVHDTAAGTLTLKTPFLGIYGIGFNLADKTGVSVENDEDFQKYLKETWDEEDEVGDEIDNPEETSCAASRGTRGYSSCSLCPAEIDGVTEISGVPLGCDNCTTPGNLVDFAWSGLFKSSCAKHDCCYNHGRMTYGMNRGLCDTVFFVNMAKKCGKKYGPFIKVKLGWIKIWLPNPGFVVYPYCMISAGGMASAAAALGGDHLVPYDQQPCYDFLRKGVDCNIPRVVVIEAETYGCEIDGSIDFTSVIYNKEDRAVTYSWTATGGTFNDPGSADVTWTSTGVEAQTVVKITCTLSDGEGNVTSKSRDVLVYQLEEWIEWGVQTGTGSYDLARSIGSDLEGNVYIAGHCRGTFPGFANMGDYDIFLQKYDEYGTLKWTKQNGTSSIDFCHGVKSDITGNVIAFGFTGGAFSGFSNAGGYDLLMQCYDADGNILWTHQSGTSQHDVIRDIAFSASGDVYAVGVVDGTYPGCIRIGNQDIIFLKYNKDGVLLWSKQVGTSSDDYASMIEVDNSGNIYIAGSTEGSLSGFSNAGAYDMVLMKFDGEGNLIWTRQKGSSGSDHFQGLSLDSAGNIFLSGQTTASWPGLTNLGGFDGIVVKYDNSGNYIFGIQDGTNKEDTFYHHNIDKHGNLNVVGYTMGALPDNSSAGNKDFYIQAYDNFGNKLGTRQFGTSALDIMYGIAGVSGDANAVYIGGMTWGSLFGVNQGKNDILLMKIKTE